MEGRVQADPSNVSEMDDAASESLSRPRHDTEVTVPRRRGDKRHLKMVEAAEKSSSPVFTLTLIFWMVVMLLMSAVR